ncbi:probable salivary secreted peptide [Drosophila rhopaloa]|uniref:Probable salivary secreted peptide n=1 Tax=Drosophila rhopaloa TaxID=1041015 RepID=A0A6P4F6C8_DRORH|nr:probable salivary secreted peptide [Drosophila rhopaloa]
MSHLVNSILVAIAIVAIANEVCGGGSTVFGVLERGAKLLHKDEIVEPHKLLRIAQRKITYKAPHLQKIGAIVITDNSESKGGKAVLLEGGPPSSFAVVRFKSERNHGLNFTMEIFDTPPPCDRCNQLG